MGKLSATDTAAPKKEKSQQVKRLTYGSGDIMMTAYA